MTYKNAGIKSKKEAAQRVLDGEQLSFEGGVIRFAPDAAATFLWAGAPMLDSVWEDFSKWQVKVNWYEDIPEHGVLCWRDSNVLALVVSISDQDSNHMILDSGHSVHRCYLTPLSDDEIRQFLRGE